MSEHINIPSNTADQKKINGVLTEMSNALIRISDEQESIREMAQDLKSKYDLAPKLTRALARSMQKRDYPEKQVEYENYEAAYEILVEGRKRD